jgi:RimJ/RimL family protein N-acetyltransferase
MDMTIVRPAQPNDAQKLFAHQERHVLESGREGDYIFSPTEISGMPPFEKWQKELIGKLQMPVTQVDWERVWVVTDENSVFGELTLTHRPPLPSCLHRATLMMGIERSHRKDGFGSQLMAAAIAWAKQQPTLDWLQLFVFEQNLPARGLYKKFGFVEAGVTPDLFRVFGQKISDVSMVLKLR